MQKRGWLLILLLLVPLVSAQDFIRNGVIPSDISSTEIAVALAGPAVVEIESYVTVSAVVPELSYQNGKVVETGPGSLHTLSKSSSGSGFIITPDGYIVTNAHVIMPAAEDAIESFVKKVLDDIKAPEEMRVPFGHYLEKILKLDIKSVGSAVLLPAFGTGGLTQIRIPAEVKKIGIPYPGKDVAIIKITRKNLPTVSMASLKYPPVGSNVVVMGYPQAAKIATVNVEPTVTSGILSAYKPMEGGWTLLQIDATISFGSSGGPVFDKNGRIIGASTLGSKTPGFNWLIPNEVIYEFLNELYIKPQRSVVDQTYERALAFYWNKRYERAIGEFHHVLELDPGHPAAPEFIINARIALEEQYAKALSWRVVVFVAGSAIIAAVIFLFFFVLKEKKEISKLRRRLHRH